MVVFCFATHIIDPTAGSASSTQVSSAWVQLATGHGKPLPSGCRPCPASQHTALTRLLGLQVIDRQRRGKVCHCHYLRAVPAAARF